MIATAVLAADYAGTLDLNEVTTVRLRATQGQNAGVDFVEAPTASIHLSDRFSAYTLTYAPTFVLPDFEEGLQPQFLNVGSATATWHYRSTSFTVTEGATYGLLNSAYLFTGATATGLGLGLGTGTGTGTGTVGQPSVAQVSPREGNITILNSTTDATLRQEIGRRVVASLSGGYFVSGGADLKSRELLPEEYGPRASASLAYALSRRDFLTTRVLVQEVSTTGNCPPPATSGICHERVDGAQLDETLRRNLSPTTTLSLGGGIAVYDTAIPDLGEAIPYPVALGTLSYHFGSRGTSELGFSAQLGPNVDPLTGFVSEYLQGGATLTDRVTPSLILHLGLAALTTVQSGEGYDVSILTGSVDATFRLDRQIDLTLGEQGLWQDHTGYGTLVSVFAYVALTVRAPPTRF
jgi:hypothetical protein